VKGVVGFQPKKKGTYAVEVTQEGKAIKGSPFRIEVGDGQLCQASKVRVTGATRDATANKWNDVNINIADAGALEQHGVYNNSGYGQLYTVTKITDTPTDKLV